MGVQQCRLLVVGYFPSQLGCGISWLHRLLCPAYSGYLLCRGGLVLHRPSIGVIPEWHSLRFIVAASATHRYSVLRTAFFDICLTPGQQFYVSFIRLVLYIGGYHIQGVNTNTILIQCNDSTPDIIKRGSDTHVQRIHRRNTGHDPPDRPFEGAFLADSPERMSFLSWLTPLESHLVVTVLILYSATVLT